VYFTLIKSDEFLLLVYGQSQEHNFYSVDIVCFVALYFLQFAERKIYFDLCISLSENYRFKGLVNESEIVSSVIQF